MKNTEDVMDVSYVGNISTAFLCSRCGGEITVGSEAWIGPVEKYHILCKPGVGDPDTRFIRKVEKFKNDTVENFPWLGARLYRYSFTNWLVNQRALQIDDEFVELLKIVAVKAPRGLLEIGTAFGGTLKEFCRFAAPDAYVFSVDLPQEQGGYKSWRTPIYRGYRRREQKLFLYKMDSHSSSTAKLISDVLSDGGRKLDFLFIDGDHSYNGVKRDFELYEPLVRKGGIIAMHDIHPGYISGVMGVSTYWPEVKKRFRKTREIINDKSQDGVGIGVVYK